MFTISEILVNVLSILMGLLSAFAAHKLLHHIFRKANFVDLNVVLGFLAISVALLTRTALFLLMVLVIRRPLL